jgi:hypothetical protein
MRARLSGNLFLLLSPLATGYGQAPGPAYQTRRSDCHYEVPTGHPLVIRRDDSGVRTSGYTAERVLTHTADASRLTGGEIAICTEYGGVEITDSDDDNVRLQIRMEGYGEGSDDPAAAARRVIEETDPRVHLTSDGTRLVVRVWHATIGFTRSGQPAQFNIRLQVPRRGAYRVKTEAYHGLVEIRRLTLAGGTLRGRVGEKFKGIPGYIFGTQLDNVAIAGDVDIENERAPLGAPITAKLRVVSSARLVARTGGEISIAVQPEPDLAVRALAESNKPGISVLLEGKVVDSLATPVFAYRRLAEGTGFDAKKVRLEIRAASDSARVRVVSMPAAPLVSRP